MRSGGYDMSNFLYIVEIERKSKTQVFSVRSISQGNELARIYWYEAWRQYVLETENGTIWSDGCLKEIVKFLEKLREDRK